MNQPVNLKYVVFQILWIFFYCIEVLWHSGVQLDAQDKFLAKGVFLIIISHGKYSYSMKTFTGKTVIIQIDTDISYIECCEKTASADVFLLYIYK